MSRNRVAGRLYLRVDGKQLRARGNFEYSLGGWEMTENVEGVDGIHGGKEKPIPAYIKGEITDRSDLDMKKLQDLKNVTVTLELANEKTILIRDAWNAAEKKNNANEASTEVDFRSTKEGEEI